MRKYASFFRMRLLAGLQYRTAALAGMSTQLVWGTMEILPYRAFWLSDPDRFPMGMEPLPAYIWLQQAFLAFFAMLYWEMDLVEAVKNGSVAYELTRPTDLYTMWMARSLALRLSRAALRAGPILLVGALVPAPYGLRLRIAPWVFLVFLASMALMLAVVCAYTVLIYAAAFYLTDVSGVMVVSVAAADLLGGAVVPLPFLPEGLRQFAQLSPFGAMQNIPLRIFGGDIPPESIPAALGLQLFWAVVLIAAGACLTRGGLRRAVILGG